MIFADIVVKAIEPLLERREWYRLFYLHSRHWIKTAKQARKRAGRKCARCFRVGIPLDVHHLNYDNIWREKPSDLQVLCRDCHNTKH